MIIIDCFIVVVPCVVCDQCGITGRERSGGGGVTMMVGVRDTAGERGTVIMEVSGDTGYNN